MTFKMIVQAFFILLMYSRPALQLTSLILLETAMLVFTVVCNIKVSLSLRIVDYTVGPALILSSVIFALGHFATIREPARLAVFFPSLVFGWLRARTKGIGAGVAFHASCNIFSELLGKGYRVY